MVQTELARHEPIEACATAPSGDRWTNRVFADVGSKKLVLTLAQPLRRSRVRYFFDQ
jgi:hypothetical protein